MATAIHVSDGLWEKLNQMKTPNEKTFEQVIWKMIEKEEFEKAKLK
jgi:predicted CopG family antitoxin